MFRNLRWYMPRESRARIERGIHVYWAKFASTKFIVDSRLMLPRYNALVCLPLDFTSTSALANETLQLLNIFTRAGEIYSRGGRIFNRHSKDELEKIRDSPRGTRREFEFWLNSRRDDSVKIRLHPIFIEESAVCGCCERAVRR